MSASDPGLRRVAVHADGNTVDLALPATIRVAVLIPSIVELLGDPKHAAARYRLSRLGASALPGSTTLAQNDIRDGTILVLSHETPEPPSRRCDEDAEAVSAALDTAAAPRRTNRLAGAVAAAGLTALGALLLARNAGGGNHAAAAAAVSAAGGVAALTSAAIAHRIFREPLAGLTLSVVATIFTAVAGLLIVPGAVGSPHVLLAAMAAAVTAALALRIVHCGVVTLTALAVCAVLIAVAALASVVTAARPHVVGSVTALACLGLLEVAPRLAILLAGLSPKLPATLDLDHTDPIPAAGELAAKARRADSWLTSLSAAFAVGAALGATFAAFTAHRAIAFAAVTAGLLLLRARADRRRTLILVVSGIATIAATFAIAATSVPKSAGWIAPLTATLAAASTYLGFVAPAISLSPNARRGIDALGRLAVTTVVPLGCWTCGAFSAVRGLVRI